MPLLLAILLAAQAAASPPIALEVERSDEVLRVSFRLREELPETIEAALPSGALVRIRYPVRVRDPRKLWWDHKLWKGEVVTTVGFDAVTGRYRGEVVLDGVIIASHEFDSSTAAREFLLDPGPVLLALPTKKKTPTLRVRVRAVFSSSTTWLIFPSVEATEWVEVTVPPPEPEEASPSRSAGEEERPD
jgi:hypothetical protein